MPKIKIAGEVDLDDLGWDETLVDVLKAEARAALRRELQPLLKDYVEALRPKLKAELDRRQKGVNIVNLVDDFLVTR